MAAFYHRTGLSRVWVTEVRGIETNVLYFHYLRHTGGFADADAVQELIKVAEQVHFIGNACIRTWHRRYLSDRIVLVGDSSLGFFIWVQTDMVRGDPSPTWIP